MHFLKELFKKEGLNKDEIEFLLERGYILSKQRSLFTRKKAEYLIKERSNESPNHTFMVLETKHFLEKNGIKVETFITKKPDLVFKIKNKTYAIEVETGEVIKHKDRLQKKVSLLKPYDHWFFIVADRNLVRRYREFGETIDPRSLPNFMKRLCKNH